MIYIYIYSRVFFPLSNDLKMKIIDLLVADIFAKEHPPPMCVDIKKVWLYYELLL